MILGVPHLGVLSNLCLPLQTDTQLLISVLGAQEADFYMKLQLSSFAPWLLVGDQSLEKDIEVFISLTLSLPGWRLPVTKSFFRSPLVLLG